jgi:hypothetical protein
MEYWKDKSNNEILLEIKQMQLDHEAVKARMLEHYEVLEAIEKRFDDANKELSKRLKGED